MNNAEVCSSSWHHLVYNNINHYLRQQMNKAAENATNNIEDTSKLKKIITILIDKISKS